METPKPPDIKPIEKDHEGKPLTSEEMARFSPEADEKRRNLFAQLNSLRDSRKGLSGDELTKVNDELRRINKEIEDSRK